MLKIKKLRESAHIPQAATSGSAGLDLCAAIDQPITILPGEICTVGTGLAMAIEPGWAGFVFARSGLGIRHGIVPANCVGVIDSDYRGELLVGLQNHGHATFVVSPGDRIAQLVLLQASAPVVEECESLDETVRGNGGFGSTGR